MSPTQLTYPAKPRIFEEISRQAVIKKLMNYPLPLLLEEHLAKRQIVREEQEFSSMGLVIPFQPCMNDEKSIEAVWGKMLQTLRRKQMDNNIKKFAETFTGRLEKIFTGLNFNTQRKSIAILLNGSSEKVIYLNYSVEPLLIFGKEVSLLVLATNTPPEANFYFLILENGRARIFEYFNKKMKLVYEYSDESNSTNLCRNAKVAVEILNHSYEIPVFASGIPELVENFSSNRFRPIIFSKVTSGPERFDDTLVNFMGKEIADQWNYWHPKFLNGRIQISKKDNTFFATLENVLKALRNCTDGLLLLDKQLKHQLLRPAGGKEIIQSSCEFIFQLERFLVRGNRIEVAKRGLLKEWGGIVLLSHDTFPFTTGSSPAGKSGHEKKGELF